jgi:integrase/recombinase XerD
MATALYIRGVQERPWRLSCKSPQPQGRGRYTSNRWQGIQPLSLWKRGRCLTGWGVHTLRHTFGAHKADKNMGIATLQELMGHKKTETTLKYIHLAKTNLRQEMSQTAL